MAPRVTAFDPEKLRATPELPTKQKQTRPQRAWQSTPFVQLPYEDALATAGKFHDVRWAILIELAYQVFKQHRNPVPLNNIALSAVGIRRDAKMRALRQLEAAGKVVISLRGKRCPLVTLRWRTPV